MERLRQNFNFAGVRIYAELLRVTLLLDSEGTYRRQGNRKLAIPQLAVKRLSAVDWKALKAAGIEGCVFDKDNTLTRPFKRELDAPTREALIACKEVFGDNLIVFSNTVGLKQYDPDGNIPFLRSFEDRGVGKEASELELQLGVKVLRHREKKPSGGATELEAHFQCKSDRLVMIGDRLITDVVYGNRHGMFTILVDPIETESEPIGVWMPIAHPLIKTPMGMLKTDDRPKKRREYRQADR